jgi:tyrosine-protein phosphatase SIW14
MSYPKGAGRRLSGCAAGGGLAVAVALVLAFPAASGGASQKSKRPETWAQPVKASNLKNIYRIDDDLYRSEQPTRKGFEEAVRLGIKSVVDLRDYHTDQSLVAGLPLFLFETPMSAAVFSEEDVVQALRAIRAAPKPVLIHCLHGSDRTGVVAAMYRVLYQGWTKEDALTEMRKGGYGYHIFYINIPDFVRGADVARIKELVEKGGGPGASANDGLAPAGSGFLCGPAR